MKRIATLLLLLLGARAYAADCVDEKEKKRLIAKKRGRRASEREYIKQGRHELTAFGGYYVSDLLDGTFVVGGMYTYHITEDIGVEASFGYSRIRSTVAERLEENRAITLLPPQDRVYLIFTDLVYSPIHGKLRLFADSILHFDLFGAAGVGIIDNATSFGAAGNLGLGARFWVSPSWAIRIDVRDQLYREVILTSNQFVQDFSVTFGVSVFVPPKL